MTQAKTSLDNFVAQQVTAVVLTFNEEDNIARTLDKLEWAREVLLVDSGSTDRTLEIARGYHNVRVITRKFDTFAAQCNYALTQVATSWVLSLDADYELSEDLISEIGRTGLPADAAGYRAGFVYRIFGRPLRGSLYPPRTILYRRDKAEYRNEGHGHRVEIEGAVHDLRAKVFHDDRKPLGRWFGSQVKYAQIEAEHLRTADRDSFNLADRIRLITGLAPVFVAFYVLFIKGCVLDGKAGLYYTLQRVVAETLLAIALLDRRFRQTQI